MKIQQLRNATIIVEFGQHRVLVDPMLSRQGALPPLRLFGARQRNPLVELPVGARAALESVTHCLITHCQKGHFDHLDRAGTQWLRERQIPVICAPHDANHLRQRGLNVQPLLPEHNLPGPFLGGHIRTVRCIHGRGVVGRLMEHGVGFLIEIPGEPSLYLAGDTLLTDEVRACVREHRPAVSVVPAGGARFDLGGDIIMGIDEVIEFTRLSGAAVVANHLEAISHCPVSRMALAEAAASAQVKLLIPEDGEVLAF
ncbi:Zn-dependent hydrolase [Ectopseudomonas mendocina]|jgi:L-ascorbate metabolism protein UlaG (beta-lactamase superfamily)|uniref:Zn-dependent hydrolase n=2 Tax=Ectopseudomonas mendocina TaxID=300 RepID=A0A379ISH9_ECTME|nr:MBL fold metallo-hydrolase [Pseudomonas mendocina]MBL0953054.1 MBL fold metallo-hydrolase [Pseudomonas sp.]ALN18433.1 Zn-dependent hydrolase [Pseudomonas mendocina S5.2]KES00721.1 Zn-dependent hydrolase [Pseudomonas mendocina]SUD34403.1 Zn-dependent hydrolase [Pseudomonas mendocina]SUD39154.1 Zn-dependent hydrolase [Pseudomonas mendocina]